MRIPNNAYGAYAAEDLAAFAAWANVEFEVDEAHGEELNWMNECVYFSCKGYMAARGYA